MKGMRRRTISNRMVAALEVERDTVFWDRELKGFGVRAYPGGGKVYVAQSYMIQIGVIRCFIRDCL